MNKFLKKNLAKIVGILIILLSVLVIYKRMKVEKFEGESSSGTISSDTPSTNTPPTNSQEPTPTVPEPITTGTNITGKTMLANTFTIGTSTDIKTVVFSTPLTNPVVFISNIDSNSNRSPAFHIIEITNTQFKFKPFAPGSSNRKVNWIAVETA